jgi:hypothetical protein
MTPLPEKAYALRAGKLDHPARLLRGFSLLRFQYVALADPATSKEAVTHHILAKKKHDHDQKD